MKTPRGRLLGRAGLVGTSPRLALGAMALLFAALGVAVFLVYQNAGIMLKQIRDDFNRQQLILARQAAAQVDADLDDIAVAIESLADNLPATARDGYGVRAFYEWGHPKGVLAVTVVSPDAGVLASHRDPSVDASAVPPAPTSCPTGNTHPAVLGALRRVDRSPESVTVTADICRPLGPTENAGLLQATLDVTRLISRALGPIRSGRTGYAWAIDADGRFLYHPDQEFVGRSAFEARHERKPYISFREIDHIMRDRMLQGEEGMGVYESGWHRGVEGQIEKLIAFTPVPSEVLGGTHVWSVAVVAPTTEVAEAVRRVYRRQYAAEGALIVGMLVLGGLAVADQRRRATALARQMGRQEEYMLSILKSSADAIVFVDNDNHVQVWNRGAELLFGYTAEEMVGHTFRRLIPPEIEAETELRRIQEEAARKGFVRDYVATRITKGGQRVKVDITRTPVHSEKGEVIGSTVIIRDVTAKMEWEQRIYNTEKLASIGNLAAGVAHEINNPLAVMLGFTDLLLERAQPGTTDYEDLQAIADSGKSARKIVENLLGFARVTEGLEDTVDVSHCIRTVAGIVKNTLMTAKVELVNDVPAGLPRVCGDPREYQQVVFNLINNAVAVMKDEGGTLTLSAEAEDGRVLLRVSDTGPGIPDRIKRRVFDPFFTTKKVGEGTGLGLSLCYGIVTKYGGSMSFTSSSLEDDPDQTSGTTFTVSMPVCERPRSTSGDVKAPDDREDEGGTQ
ncbi:MAG: PAS domain S-box protein [Acidobacteria bacterium]|nr:PAS domain S-box protein [Acidobacteriota bacterium]